MANEHNKVFWIKSGETFAGKGQGEEITEYFFNEDGEALQAKRLAKLKKDGYVSTEKPINIETASEMELNQLRETAAEQTQEIADLKDAAKTAPKPSKAAAEKLSKAKSELVEVKAELAEVKNNAVPSADPALTQKVTELESQIIDKDVLIENSATKISELESQVAELTKPDEETAPPADDQPGPKKVKK